MDESLTFKDEPLAYRMRPKRLSEIVGQEEILKEGSLLYRAIEADRLSSMILYGPPGTGKTTIAQVIAKTTESKFKEINATKSGKKEMEEIVNEAIEVKKSKGFKTILFIDEIHRFNKSQQDFLLPFVENGTIILIGATTENPYFEVNKALISRSIIFQLNKLTTENILKIIEKTLRSKDGYKNKNISLEENAKMFLAQMSDGDARRALNALELAVLTTPESDDGVIYITLDIAQDCMQKRVMNYDKDGNSHYDTVSAFIKSMRGSDPDAAVYYLARMLKSGEDIKFIARRIIICASEDVGNADPQALQVAVACSQAVERIGLPEAQIILAQAVIYIANAPKSNTAIKSINAALDLVERTGNLSIPPYLRDSHYPGAEKLGNGKGYKYPHDYPGHFVKQQYLPDEIKDIKIVEGD
jgi:putative ATPase